MVSKMIRSYYTSGRTNDEQGSLNVASEENSPTARSLSRSRLG
ncbi:hypothetical protein pdam_00001016, partial [Pocillopora damicornis]